MEKACVPLGHRLFPRLHISTRAILKSGAETVFFAVEERLIRPLCVLRGEKEELHFIWKVYTFTEENWHKKRK